MAEKPQPPSAPDPTPAATTGPTAPKRGPGHRGADVRDTVAEMAARAQEISQEAGSKMASAMRDVISAAAGLAGFSVESARDLVQYMVRRGQMTQDEADRLIREAEDAASKRKVNLPPPPSKQPKPAPVTPVLVHPIPAPVAPPPEPVRPAEPVVHKAAAKKPAHPAAQASHPPKKAAAPAHKTAAKKPSKAAAKAPAKKAAKKR